MQYSGGETENLGERVGQEIGKHRAIRIKFADKVKLLLQKMFCGSNFCCLVKGSKGRFMKLYHMMIDGEVRLNKELDVVKIMQRLRVHDVALRSSVLNTEERRHQVKHARKFIIDVDSSDDGSDVGEGVEASYFEFDDFGKP